MIAEKTETNQTLDKTILIVDDDAAFLKLVQRILKEAGFDTIGTVSTDEAIQMAREKGRKIDLLLVDVVMPEMSGRELADEIEMLQPEIESLFMSGYTRISNLHYETMEKGVHFIEKPFEPDNLIEKVRELTGIERGCH